MEQAEITQSKMQYLYNDGSNYVFMNNETYDQISIPNEKVKEASKYLLENMEVNVTSYGSEILGIEVPIFMSRFCN